MYAIGKMFDPAVVALIGATERQGTVGRTILENLLSSKERRVYPINPHEQTVLGRDTLSVLPRFQGLSTWLSSRHPQRRYPTSLRSAGGQASRGW